jgi:toxin ParE1/3/4
MPPSYQIKWLKKALINLDAEAGYIAKENPTAANAVVKKIQQAIKNLEQNPALGYAGRIHGTRELIVAGTRYLIPYRVNPREHRIEILRVFHTSRKLPPNW